MAVSGIRPGGFVAYYAYSELKRLACMHLSILIGEISSVWAAFVFSNPDVLTTGKLSTRVRTFTYALSFDCSDRGSARRSMGMYHTFKCRGCIKLCACMCACVRARQSVAGWTSSLAVCMHVHARVSVQVRLCMCMHAGMCV